MSGSATDGARVAIVYDGAAVDDPSTFDVGLDEAQALESIMETVIEVERALAGRGYRPSRLVLRGDGPAVLHQIADVEADVFFNFVESLRGTAELEAAVRGAMAVRGIPVTGASFEALGNCLHKPRTRAILAGAGVPVARGKVLHTDADDASDLGYPVMVKPAAQDASHGIDGKSVCATPEAAKARAMHLVSRGIGPALVEEFVDGREFNVSMLETMVDGERRLRALPVAEIDFSGFPPDVPRILTYSAKWDYESQEYKGSVSVEAKNLPGTLHADLERHAIAAFRALGLSGYGRVDFRVNAASQPFVVDVNPNPDFSRGAGLHLAGQRAGLTYEDLVDHVVRTAAG